MVELTVRVQQTASRIKVVYTLANPSTHAVYVQNRYGAPRRAGGGVYGGGRSLNDTSDKRAPFSTGSACVWPSKDGTLVLFQGDVPPAVFPAPAEWPEPAFSKIDPSPTTFEIELGRPIHQWENNGTKPASGPLLKVRRLTLCLDALLDPLVAQELDGAPGSFACDYGQPGYVEATMELDRPVEIVTELGASGRGDAKLAALKTLVRLNGPPPSRPGRR
jgi:hypothetical protein